MASYKDRVQKALINKFPGRNVQSLPSLEKIVVSSGIGKLMKSVAAKPDELLKEFREILSRVTGQMPQERQARLSVASFGIRKGDVIGLRTTLRKKKMYDFLERLIVLAIPRFRDFRGVSKKSLDDKGNLTLGIRELVVFPEVSQQPRASQLGAEVTLVVNAKNQDEVAALHEALGIPFAKR